MGQRVLCGVIAAISLGLASGSVLAQTAAIVSSPNAAASCSALLSADFSHVEDAPLQLTDARVIAASGKSPAYCRVRGYIWPQVGIEMHLPLASWNGKFMEVGDGGWGGEMYLFLCKGPVRRGPIGVFARRT